MQAFELTKKKRNILRRNHIPIDTYIERIRMGWSNKAALHTQIKTPPPCQSHHVLQPK